MSFPSSQRSDLGQGYPSSDLLILGQHVNYEAIAPKAIFDDVLHETCFRLPFKIKKGYYYQLLRKVLQHTNLSLKNTKLSELAHFAFYR